MFKDDLVLLKLGRLFLTVSPLCEAVLILGAGFDVSKVTVMEEHYPLYAAIIHGYIDMASTLIEAGAPIDDIYRVESHTPLTFAILVGRHEMIPLLLESGVDASQPTTGGTKSASEVEMYYSNERSRSAIEHAEELTKNRQEKKPETVDDSGGSELIAERK